MAYVDTKPIARKPGIALALAINGAGVIAAFLATGVIKEEPGFIDTIVTFPEAEPESPPPKPDPTPPKSDLRTPPITSTLADALPTPLPPIQPPIEDYLPPVPPTPPTPPVIPDPPMPPVIQPVLREARVDPSFAALLQPEYPESAIRREISGKVSVRVKIGTDGKVLAANLVSATDDVFVDNTLRQALKKWRFLPATRDGKPEESWRLMTVRFELPA